MTTGFRIGLGALLVVIGLLGMLMSWPALPPMMQQPGAESELHETMGEMMDAMHGPGTADRIRQIPGGEEMMHRCASMMGSMLGAMMPSPMGEGP